ncbi:MAG: Mth938-like domain-containing protein, partial [Acidobacteriota bacterium]
SKIMIDSYKFGQMVIDGKKYTKDLIIYPEEVKSSWWRETGHLVTLEDLKEVFAHNPKILIIGTGYMGLMKVDHEVKKYAEGKVIKLIIQNSKKAVQTFNQKQSEGPVFGAFHLTC